MRILKYSLGAVMLILLWSAFIFMGLRRGYLLTAFSDPEQFVERVAEKSKEENVYNIALARIEGGEVVESYYQSKTGEIDAATLLQVASVSKWFTAWGVMHLAEDGRIDLDLPVENYLKRWKFPESPYDSKKVTVRMLLNHTSGIGNDSGYLGFENEGEVQSLEASLSNAIDVADTERATTLLFEPGSRYYYSSKGYTILQLLVEEVTGESFQDYMTREVFLPLNMTNSTFILKERKEQKIANSFNQNGKEAPLYRYTATGAASLFTTIDELIIFLNAHSNTNSVLNEASILSMYANAHPINPQRQQGLGPVIFNNASENFIIGHDGNLRPALNVSLRYNTTTESGIVLFETGSSIFASQMADEWMHTMFEIPTYTAIVRNQSWLMSSLILGNILIIVILIFSFRKRRKISA